MDLTFPTGSTDEVGGTFEPLPEGKYNAVLYDLKPVEFNSGNQGLKADFRILDEPHTKRHVFENYVLLANCMPKLAKLLKACGVDVPDGGTITNFRPSQVVGSKVRINVGQNEWNGKIQNNVKFVDPPVGGAQAPGAKEGFDLDI